MRSLQPISAHDARARAHGALALEALAAARADAGARVHGLGVGAVRSVWSAWGAGVGPPPTPGIQGWGAPFDGGALGEGPPPPGDSEGVPLDHILRFLSYRGGAVVACCPAALEDAYNKAIGSCLGPPGSCRNGNTITDFQCEANGSGGCQCHYTCEGCGVPGGRFTFSVASSVECSFRDYLGSGGFGSFGGVSDPEESDGSCVEEPPDLDKCGSVPEQACDEFNACGESETEPTGEVRFYFVYSSDASSPDEVWPPRCSDGDVALLKLLLDDAAELIMLHVGLVLHVVCRLFGPDVARRVAEFFNEPVTIRFADGLPGVMAWYEATDEVWVDCQKALARTVYGTDSTECATAWLAAIVVHELMHRLPERFEHLPGEYRDCVDTTRLTQWLRDELFRRLGCAST